MNGLPGFGDVATWGPCYGHPSDPRTEIDDAELAREEYAEDLDGAADLLDSAASAVREGHETRAEKLVQQALALLGGEWVRKT